ncbi:MAG: hypothetical protein ACRC2T_03565 [Thermoguttaceae bacterium]
MKKNNILKILCVLSVLVLIAVTGCGPKAPYQVVPIAGNAYYDDKPIPEGFRIDFCPVNGTRTSVGIIKGTEGAFTAIHSADQDGVATGPCKVNVGMVDALSNQPPAEFAAMVAKYGFGTDGIPVEITKKNMKIKIEFPKAE